MSIEDEFNEAPVRSVVPLQMAECRDDPHFVPVERYPLAVVPLTGEVGAFCILQGLGIHAVTSRIVCHTDAINPIHTYHTNEEAAQARNKIEAGRYVAASVPGAPFMDRRGQ